MQYALDLARKGQFTARPNPCVGCVIVKEGRLLGQGWHVKSGLAHAEVNALNDAYQHFSFEEVMGADAYVTLEPCDHLGKTPPCTDALIRAKVKRVIAAMEDPNPLVSGKGFAKLRAAGIDVIVGIARHKAEQLNVGYCYAMRYKQSYVRCKLAASIDGRTAMANGESKWITGPKARQDVQYLRAQSGAVITGVGTVLADNPLLTVRPRDWPQPPEGEILQPIRVLMDHRFRIPISSRLFSVPGEIWWVGLQSCYAALRGSHAGEGLLVKQILLEREEQGLRVVLKQLFERGIFDVLVEAGSILSGAFLKERLVNELWLYQAPLIMGSTARSLVEWPLLAMSEAQRWQYQSFQQLGNDMRFILTPVNEEC